MICKKHNIDHCKICNRNECTGFAGNWTSLNRKIFDKQELKNKNQIIKNLQIPMSTRSVKIIISFK